MTTYNELYKGSVYLYDTSSGTLNGLSEQTANLENNIRNKMPMTEWSKNQSRLNFVIREEWSDFDLEFIEALSMPHGHGSMLNPEIENILAIKWILADKWW